MKAFTVALLSALAIALAVWLTLRTASSSALCAPTEPSPALQAETEPAPGATASRTAVATPASTRETGSQPLRIIGRCVDEQGRPLPDCVVSLRGRLDVERAEMRGASGPFVAGTPVMTAGNGRFELRITRPQAWRFSLQVASEPFALQRTAWQDWPENAGEVLDLGDLVMAAACSITGTAVDEAGDTVAHAMLRLSRQRDEIGGPAPTPRDSVTIAADSRGYFGTQALRPGRWAIHSQRPRRIEPLRELRLRPGANGHLLVTVPGAADGMAGTVVDRNGQPVVAARVQLIGVPGANPVGARTDAKGRFWLDCPAESAHERARLRVWDPTATAGVPPTVSAAAHPFGARHIRLVVTRRPALEFIVTDAATNAPVEHFGVRVFQDPARGYANTLLRHAGHHPGGRVTVAGLPPGPCFAMVVPLAGDFGPSQLHTIDVAAAGTPPVRIELGRRASRWVELVDARDEPVAGATLQLVEPLPGHPVSTETRAAPWPRIRLGDQSAPHRGAGPRAGVAALRQEHRTDARGRARLIAPPGDYALVLPGPGHVPSIHAVVRLEPDLEPLRIRVERGATVTGTLSPTEAVGWQRPLGHPEPGRDDGALRARLVSTRSDAPRLWQRLFDTPIAADGTFAFGGIPAGEWRVRVLSRDGAVSGPVIHTDGSGQHTTTVDVSALMPGDLTGHVLLNGTPAAGLVAIAHGPGGTRETRVDEHGAFRFRLPQGAYQMRFARRSRRGPEQWYSVRGRVRVVPGAMTRYDVRLRHTVLTITVVDRDAKTPLVNRAVTLDVERAFGWYRVRQTDAQGKLTLDPAPDFPFSLELLPDGPDRESGPRRRSDPVQPDATTRDVRVIVAHANSAVRMP